MTRKPCSPGLPPDNKTGVHSMEDVELCARSIQTGFNATYTNLRILFLMHSLIKVPIQLFIDTERIRY